MVKNQSAIWSQFLNVAAAIFAPKLNAHQYVVGTSNAARDLLHVQEVQAGGVGHPGRAAGHLFMVSLRFLICWELHPNKC